MSFEDFRSCFTKLENLPVQNNQATLKVTVNCPINARALIKSSGFRLGVKWAVGVKWAWALITKKLFSMSEYRSGIMTHTKKSLFKLDICSSILVGLHFLVSKKGYVPY